MQAAGAANTMFPPETRWKSGALTVFLRHGQSFLAGCSRLFHEFDLHVVHLCVPSSGDGAEEGSQETHGEGDVARRIAAARFKW